MSGEIQRQENGNVNASGATRLVSKLAVMPLRECPLKSRLVDQILGVIPWDEKPLPTLAYINRVRGLNWSSGRSIYKP